MISNPPRVPQGIIHAALPRCEKLRRHVEAGPSYFISRHQITADDRGMESRCVSRPPRGDSSRVENFEQIWARLDRHGELVSKEYTT